MKYLNADWFKENLMKRKVDGHKQTFGHVLVMGGSEGKCGAPILTSKAALRTGCGLVTAYVPENAVQALLSVAPEIMSVVQDMPRFLSIDMDKVHAIAFGPGFGTDFVVRDLLLHVIGTYPEKPIVIDADGLNVLSQNPHEYEFLNQNHILTPHVGEFSRLLGDQFDINKIFEQAHAFAIEHQVNLVIKGKNSRIFTFDGEIFENTTGNSGMATAGSGDVLTGIIASLCAQGYSPKIAACMGVYLHGLAGDIAIRQQSEASLIASDIVEALKVVMNYEL